MKRSAVIYDVMFYAVIPLVIWNLARDLTGDYGTMLLSSVPGILYTVYQFTAMRKVKFTGLFILCSLIFGSLLDIVAGSAIQLMWNSVIYGFVMSSFYLVSMAVNRPAAVYFSLDAVEMKGYNRGFVKGLYYKYDMLRIFQWITLLFAIRNAMVAVLNIWLIQSYGVDGFDKGIVLKQLVSGVMMGVVMLGFIYARRIIRRTPEWRRMKPAAEVTPAPAMSMKQPAWRESIRTK